MIEGSRHERAALVTIAYIIGGITAFIAFGVNALLINQHAGMPAAVVTALPDNLTAAAPSDISDNVVPNDTVRYEGGILEVQTVDGVKTLSFNPQVLGIEVSQDFQQQGFHYGTPVWKVSTSGQFVFFCERHDPVSTDCLAFVYDVLRGSIHPVSYAGDRNPINAELATAARFENDQLFIGNLRSESTVNPWNLVYR